MGVGNLLSCLGPHLRIACTYRTASYEIHDPRSREIQYGWFIVEEGRLTATMGNRGLCGAVVVIM